MLRILYYIRTLWSFDYIHLCIFIIPLCFTVDEMLKGYKIFFNAQTCNSCHVVVILLQAKAIKIDNLTPEELIGIIDDTLACMVSLF